MTWIWLKEGYLCTDLMLGIVEEKCVIGKPLVHLLIPLEGQMDSGKPSSNAGEAHRSTGRHGVHLGTGWCRWGGEWDLHPVWMCLESKSCWAHLPATSLWARALALLLQCSRVIPIEFWFSQPHCGNCCLQLEQGSWKGICCMGSSANTSATEVILMGILLYFWHHLLLVLITDARRD